MPADKVGSRLMPESRQFLTLPEEILVCSECGTFASRDPAWGPASPITSAYVARHYPALWEAWKKERKA
ncbi:MAG: hypothetical protein HY217_02050 [Candidatus Rokubacteria bacterium]|nr:hypothetical protein [Candidatus Rokubacteria bacterium]